MSTVDEWSADLTTTVRHLEELAVELRGSPRWRIPEISAASDALTCAAILLSTQRDGLDGAGKHLDLLREAIALARSVVETSKFACFERVGPRLPANGKQNGKRT